MVIAAKLDGGLYGEPGFVTILCSCGLETNLPDYPKQSINEYQWMRCNICQNQLFKKPAIAIVLGDCNDEYFTTSEFIRFCGDDIRIVKQ